MRTAFFVLSFALLSLASAVALQAYVSKAAPAPGDLTACPDAGRWVMSVWTGDNLTPTRTALAECPEVPVAAAYYLEPVSQGWLSFDVNAPDALNSLTTVSNLQPLFLRGQAAQPQTIEIEAYDDYFQYAGQANPQVPVPAGVDFTIVVKNQGAANHNIRISGPDKQLGTTDDVVSDPFEISAGGQGTLQSNISQPGNYPFWCDFHVFEDMEGTLVVQ
jgi:hypothetical protein